MGRIREAWAEEELDGFIRGGEANSPERNRTPVAMRGGGGFEVSFPSSTRTREKERLAFFSTETNDAPTGQHYTGPFST